MSWKCTNTKQQGDLGLGNAIAYFTSEGYTVSIPLTDSQDYDLIVDKNLPQRVQVKTTKFKTEYKVYQVQLTIKGGNRTGSTIKKLNADKVDLIFILTEEGTRYLIPVSELSNRSMINLGEKYTKYIV